MSPWAQQQGDFHYGPERWERTCGLLSRVVHIDISPDLSERHVEAIAMVLEEALADL